ncbi:MAG: DUF5916 domain-containing protein [Acidobacteriota bacterium]|nr:DUF5916 domain-containing protein [Acidobacteriota bacterium]
MFRVTWLIAAAILWPAGLSAQQPDVMNSGRRVVTAERLKDDEKVVLDGILDEPAWARATSAGEFVMQDPILGGAPTERTDIRIVFNKDHLYIGVTNYDSEPGKLLGNTRKRDEFLSADDRFMWTMDTFLNQQTGYFFEMNPAGLMADALMGPGGSNNREWDGIWNARVRQSEIGWVIEIDIPFRTLAFDPNAPAWGINFQCTVRRKNEELMWTGYQRNQGLRRMSNAGLLVGLTDVTQGKGLEVKPYVAGTVADGPGRTPAVETETTADVGGEVTYNITPSLRAVGTINTDFAETEVDTRRVNLTRFPLFFPEKRGFFLDGATFFDFPNNAFFSRRIGLTAGQPQRVIGGGKVTGQAGRQDVGLLYVRTGDDGAAIGENFLVARARRRTLQQSYVGALYTVRDAPADATAAQHTAGVDFRLATSTFRKNKNLFFTGYLVANSAVGGARGGRTARGAMLDYPNDVVDMSLSFQEVQAQHNPAVGFTSRREFRRYTPEARWNPRPAGNRSIRRFGFGAQPNVYTNLQGDLETVDGNIQAFRMELHSGDNLEFNVSPSYEYLKDDFQIAPGVVLPAGTDYRFTRYAVSANTANKRVVSIRPRLEWGTFYSGDRLEASLGMGVRPRPGVTLNLSYEFNDVDLAEGSFQTKLYRMVADTQFSPFMYLVNNVQYDSVSRILGWQSRFRWIVTPGNDIFVVYTQNWLDPSDPAFGFRTLDRRGATKAVYTKRF